MAKKIDKNISKWSNLFGPQLGKEKDNPSKMEKPDFLKQYDISQLNYPMNLFSAEVPVGPYVMFYINVSSEAKITSLTGNAEFIDDFDHSTRKTGAARRMARKEGFTAEGAFLTSGVIATGLVGGIAGVSAGGASFASVALAAAASSTQGLSFNKPQKRLKEAIALHMPNNLGIRYSVDYSTDSAAGFLGAMKIGKAGVDFVKGAVGSISNAVTSESVSATDAAKNIVAQGKTQFSNASSALAATALENIPGGKVISNVAGVAANPMMQSTFNGVNSREFELDYVFYPKDETELDQIHRIIKTFKGNMLPEYKGSDEFLFVYPSEFDIVYYMGGLENEYLHKHTSCVLTNMTVNYTPDSVYTYFNKNGAPTKIIMTLAFRELDIVTKEDVQDGY